MINFKLLTELWSTKPVDKKKNVNRQWCMISWLLRRYDIIIHKVYVYYIIVIIYIWTLWRFYFWVFKWFNFNFKFTSWLRVNDWITLCIRRYDILYFMIFIIMFPPPLQSIEMLFHIIIRSRMSNVRPSMSRISICVLYSTFGN